MYVLELLLIVALFLEVVLIEIHQASIDQTSIVQQLRAIHQTSFNQTTLIQQLHAVVLSLQTLALVMALAFGSRHMDVLTLMEVDFIAQQLVKILLASIQVQLIDVMPLSKEVELVWV